MIGHLDGASGDFWNCPFSMVGKGSHTLARMASEVVERGRVDGRHLAINEGSVPFSSNPRCSGSAEERRVREGRGWRERYRERWGRVRVGERERETLVRTLQTPAASL